MKTKLLLLLILTLVIGFVLGWLTSTQVRLHRLKPVRMYISDEHFRDGFFKIIQPDDQQKEEIEKILDKYAKINSDFQSDIRKDIDSNMKAFRKELDSKLTKEQITRLKEMDDRRQEMIKHSMKNRSDSTFKGRTIQGNHGPDHPDEEYQGRMQGPPPPHPVNPADTTL